MCIYVFMHAYLYKILHVYLCDNICILLLTYLQNSKTMSRYIYTNLPAFMIGANLDTILTKE